MSTESQFITVYVKDLAGSLLTVECPSDMPPGDFPFRVYPLLPVPRPPMAFLRFLPSHCLEKGDKDKSKDKDEGKDEKENNEHYFSPHSFPMRFSEGDLFYLFVEDPELVVRFERQDDALVPSGDTMEMIRMEVLDQTDTVLLCETFYTPVITSYHYIDGEDVPVRGYTDVYYHEEDVEVLFNQPERVREFTGIQWRDVVVRPGATAHSTPGFLARRYYRAEYEAHLVDRIEEAWRNYVKEATGQEGFYHLAEQASAVANAEASAVEDAVAEDEDTDVVDVQEEDYDY